MESERILESDVLRVVIDPIAGGKVRSFISKKTKIEYFWQDVERQHKMVNYSTHDMSGFDECFPTITVDKYRSGKLKGKDLADHGHLWQDPWECKEEDGAVVLFKDLPEFECSFERAARLSNSSCLRLDYHVKNYGDEPFTYLYSAHPLLATTPDMRLHFPEGMQRAFTYVASESTKLPEGEWTELTSEQKAIMARPYALDESVHIKLFTDKLSEGKVSISRPGVRESFCIQFDLSHLGVFISHKVDLSGDGTFAQRDLLGLEPTSGAGDDYDLCKASGTLKELLPGDDLRFWISLSLEE